MTRIIWRKNRCSHGQRVLNPLIVQGAHFLDEDEQVPICSYLAGETSEETPLKSRMRSKLDVLRTAERRALRRRGRILKGVWDGACCIGRARSEMRTGRCEKAAGCGNHVVAELYGQTAPGSRTRWACIPVCEIPVCDFPNRQTGTQVAHRACSHRRLRVWYSSGASNTNGQERSKYSSVSPSSITARRPALPSNPAPRTHTQPPTRPCRPSIPVSRPSGRR